MQPLIVLLVIGAIAGWAAGVLVKNYGFGLLGNMAAGVMGSIVGGMVFSGIGPLRAGGMMSTIVCAILGALFLLFLIRFIPRTAWRSQR